MKSRSCLLWFGFAGGLTALGGCASSGANATRTFARPHVAPAALAPAAPAAPVDAFATAQEHAQRGDLALAAHSIARIPAWAERDRTAARLAGGLAETDPVRAAQFALALPADRGGTAAIEGVGHVFARRDENAALAWAMGLADTANRGAALRIVTAHWMCANPASALDRMLALPASPARDEAARNAAVHWVRQDSAAALAWLRDLPDSAHKPGLTASMGFELAQKDPRAALALCETMPAGVERRLVWIAAAQTWAAQDEDAASRWAAQLPAGEARELALQGFNNAMGVGRQSSRASVRRGFR